MPTRNRIFLAIVLFLIPILARTFTYYQNPFYKAEIQRPDYTRFQLPEPPTPSSAAVAIAAPAGEGKVTILDAYHGNQYTPNEIEPLVTALSARGGRVEFDRGAQPLANQLKYASAYFIMSPSIAFSNEELRAIYQFVESGGRLVVFADPTRATIAIDALTGSAMYSPDVNYANPVLAPFGLSIVNDYLYNVQDNEGNFRNVKFTDFADHSLTRGLKMVVFYGVHSVKNSAGMPLVNADRNTFSSLTDRAGAFSPLALSDNGQVLAVGDFSFLTNPFNQVADNGLLLDAIADFALGSERVASLVNFPYLFSRPVNLTAVGDVQLDASLLGPIASLQNALKLVNIPLSVRAKTSDGNDAIILGTLQDSDAIKSYAQPFGIGLDELEKGLEIKGLGPVSAKDSGLLLFSKGPKSNMLVLLAPTAKMLPELVKLVAAGDLSECVVQENIGICALTPMEEEGDYSYDDYYYDYEIGRAHV